MKRFLPLLALLLLSGAALSQPTTPKDSANWADWAFMLGEWHPMESGGVPGPASNAWATLAPDLDGKVLVRKNHGEYAAANGRPAYVHDDLMVIYHQGAATKAFYTDNEGHTIHYDVSFSADKKRLVFLSEKAPGPQFRLTYENVQPGTLKVIFEIAPPDKPDQFARYVEGTIRRK